MRRGQALILVLVLINVFLIIVFVASDLMLSELVIQRRMDNSMRAYYAAEAGAEKAILAVKGGDCDVPLTVWTDVASDTSINYQYKISHPGTECEIESTGRNLNAIRKLLIKTPDAVGSGQVLWPSRWKEINP